MNEFVVAEKATEWRRLKALVLDSISSPITKRVYNLGLNEFNEWYMLYGAIRGCSVKVLQNKSVLFDRVKAIVDERD